MALTNDSKQRETTGVHEPADHKEFLKKFDSKPPKGMVLIPAGEFSAGMDPKLSMEACRKLLGNQCRIGWYTNESPEHNVWLNAFYIDIYEVTQQHFERVMGKNPSKFKGANRPVEKVTWEEANQYCQRVGKRLPTEAEWEKAAKGGRDSLFPWGNEVGSNRANCDGCGSQWDNIETAPVGSFEPNGYGLYDMAGNAWEWIADWYDRNYYNKIPRENPRGPTTGKLKVLRGGAWGNNPLLMRSAARSWCSPTKRADVLGFRCVADV